MNVGIIGCGYIARFHYEGYAKAGACILHACDIRPEAAQSVADRYGARATTDYREVLADPAVDIVSVLTSASSHKAICLAAIAAGKGVVCGGSHILDLIHWFGGRPTQVCGQMRVLPNMDFDRQANAMLWLENGGLVHLEACWHPLVHGGYERNGWDERLEINCARGRLDFYTVKWDQPENNGALLVHQDAATGKTTEYRYPAVNPFHLEMAEMLRRFAAGEPACPSAWDGYVVDQLIADITASAQTGQVVRVQYAG